MKVFKVKLPLTEKDIKSFSKGDIVYISGNMFVMRDRAHKRYLEDKNKDIDFSDSVIFYAGPTESGIYGPTTSKRMDPFARDFANLGVKLFVGKGDRDPELIKDLKKNNSLCGYTFGGVSSYLTDFILESEVIKYKDLGCEAIRRIKVKNFPVIIM